MTQQTMEERLYDEFIVGNNNISDEYHKALKDFINQEIYFAVQQERERNCNIILRRTEIPKGARKPTRDGTVLLGEELVELINK